MRHTLGLALLILASPFVVWGVTVFVTAVVPGDTPPEPSDTVVVFRGFAYPGAQVTILREAAIVATVPADPSARFDITLSHQTPGIVTYSAFSEDSSGRIGRTSVFTLTITAGTTTTVSGIFLGPTITANKTLLQLSDTVTILGTTAPSSEVTIFVSSEVEKIFRTTASVDGVWLKQVLGTELGVGDHNARAKAVAPTSEISGFSNTIAFSVTDVVTPPNACTGKNRADINCDGKVNLTDFSILLFFWKKTNPTNVRADISGDHLVNLTDLSILFFNWTRP